MVSVFTSGFTNTETILHFFNKQQSSFRKAVWKLQLIFL